MIRRPPRSTLSSSSAASDVYKRQVSTQSTWGIKIYNFFFNQQQTQNMQTAPIKATKLSETKVHSGKWISFYQASYELSNDQKINNWEYIKREQLPAIANGVETIPILKNPETGIDKLLLISNFRPPVGTWSIEFPAGLIEANEGAQSAAIREFTEETGYQKFKFVDNPVNLKEQVCYFDPWKSTETNINFIIEVEEGSKGEQNLDKEESIDVFFLELDGNIVEKLMKYAEDKKQIISQDVWMFVLGFSYAKKFQKQS
eukprot:TRINITY_DN859_c0_g1_i1.p1 TRINITY_DN859_c0_g1~~TRINITY_DN859_c0_g1_i1.p1  ORF type:complete len:258 (-),score=59.78 TRINITY_DN859_c0_g1_i1:109-882(-)